MPDWQDRPEAAQLARDEAWNEIGRLLGDDIDVVLPQMILREDVLADLEAIVARSGSSLIEVFMGADPAAARARFLARRAQLANDGIAHPERDLDVASFEAIVDRLRQLAAAWPGAMTLDPITSSLEECAARVQGLAAAPPC